MRRLIDWVVVSGIALLAIMCYAPGLAGEFLFDDVINIQNNLQIRISHLDMSSLWQAAMSSSAGMLHRPVSMLTFALNYYFSGDVDPYYFKAVNLGIHLLNGVGLYFLTRLLLGLYAKLHRPQLDDRSVQWMSLGVAAIWLLHPFNLTGVLYVVQRMASLSALFVLVGLMLYVLGRQRQNVEKTGGWPAILTAVFVCTPLAVLSKESGLLLPVFMLLVEVTILRWQMPDARGRRRLKALFAGVVALPAFVLSGYVLLHPGFIAGGYWIRDFTLAERLMTEARVLWFYLHMTLLPSLSTMGFYHDDIVISRALLAPPTTLAAIAGLLGLLVGAWMLRKKHSLVAFGILFFLVGHSMESSVIALELVHEHRNYLPMFGLLLPVVYYALDPACHPSSLRLRKIGLIVMVMLFAVLTWMRANQWSTPLGMMQMEVQHHPDSVRANSDLAFQYAYLPAKNQFEAEEHYRNAILHFSRAANLSETDTAGFFGIIAVNAERGITTDPSWSDELERRLEHLPSSPSSINSLMALEKCLASGRCKHGPELMERLLRAALRNPSLTGPRRSTALFALSDFLFKVGHLPEQAVEVAYQAVAAAPDDIAQRLTLIVFLVNMSKLDEASTEIGKARNSDTQGAYTPALNQLERQLAEIRMQSLSRTK